MSIYAVNGKIPVAAWIPSRDTAGNGTTTLNDLVGTNHGTLTNMDAATDWVADTANGGVRALDFDGSNDFISTGLVLPLTGDWSVSSWFKTSQSSEGNIISNNEVQSGRCDIKATSLDGGVYKSLIFINGSPSLVMYGTTTTNDNQWNLLTVTRSSNLFSLYVNGALENSASSSNAISSTTFRIGLSRGDLQGLLGRVDDIRIFNTALTASDVAQLYRNGNGRGVTANSNTFQLGMPI